MNEQKTPVQMEHGFMLAVYQHYQRENNLEAPLPKFTPTPRKKPPLLPTASEISTPDLLRHKITNLSTAREKSISSSQITERFKTRLKNNHVKDQQEPTTPRIRIRSLERPRPTPTIAELDLALGKLEQQQRELTLELQQENRGSEFRLKRVLLRNGMSIETRQCTEKDEMKIGMELQELEKRIKQARERCELKESSLKRHSVVQISSFKDMDFS